MASTTGLIATLKPSIGKLTTAQTNTNLQNIDSKLRGTVTKSLAAAHVTLTTAEAMMKRIIVNGTIAADRNLIVPTVEDWFLVTRSTSGAYNVTVKTASGTGVNIAPGATILVYCDGTNVVAINTVGIGTISNSASGTTPGNCVKKAQVYDVNGTSLGYVAIYDAIT